MYSLVRALPAKQFLLAQLPVMLISLIIAELFYKFGSFTLEAITFLATWFVLDAVLSAAFRLEEKWRGRGAGRRYEEGG